MEKKVLVIKKDHDENRTFLVGMWYLNHATMRFHFKLQSNSDQPVGVAV